jgi:hypothetical protein
MLVVPLAREDNEVRITLTIGNVKTAACHHPAYDFIDAAIPHGVSYGVRLVELGMPA